MRIEEVALEGDASRLAIDAPPRIGDVFIGQRQMKVPGLEEFDQIGKRLDTLVQRGLPLWFEAIISLQALILVAVGQPTQGVAFQRGAGDNYMLLMLAQP